MRDPRSPRGRRGSGAIAPYDTHIAISTTAWISARVPFKRTDILHQIATVPGVDPAHPIVVNNQETGGAALHWLREQIVAPDDGLLGGGSGIGAEGAAAEGLAPSFDDLIRLAGQAPPGCEGLLFMPWLNGERSPAEDKTVRAGWLNLSLRTDRAMLVRSVLEGVAYNARWLFDAYEKFLRRPVPKVRLLGGGAQSDLWCQIYADVFGRPVEQVADPRNAQLRGVALWARICLGELTLDDVPALVPVPERFLPTSEAAAYARSYAEYRKLFGSLKGLYHRLNRGGDGLASRRPSRRRLQRRRAAGLLDHLDRDVVGHVLADAVLELVDPGGGAGSDDRDDDVVPRQRDRVDVPLGAGDPLLGRRLRGARPALIEEGAHRSRRQRHQEDDDEDDDGDGGAATGTGVAVAGPPACSRRP